MSDTKIVTAVAELHYRDGGEKKVVEAGLTAALPSAAAGDFLASKAAREPTEDEAALYGLRAGKKASKPAADAATDASKPAADAATDASKPAADAPKGNTASAKDAAKPATDASAAIG